MSASYIDNLDDLLSPDVTARTVAYEDITTKEKVYFSLLVISSVVLYIFFISVILLTLKTGPTLLFYLIGYFLFFWFAHGLYVAYVRCNGIRVSANQLPGLNKLCDDIALHMKMPECPDVFIIQGGGFLNAFATRFLGRSFIVLYDEVLELGGKEGEESLAFIIAHEMAHHKRGHVSAWKKLATLPGHMVPFLGLAYSRACEYTCDAMAHRLFTTGAFEGVAALSIGKLLFKKVDIKQALVQLENERGFFSWLSEIFSTHPHSLSRLQALSRLGNR